jgi:hypothetical protein
MCPIDTNSGSDLAAQLARAAYRVALKYGVEGSWVELELEMWDALSHALYGHEQQRSYNMSPSELRKAPGRHAK